MFASKVIVATILAVCASAAVINPAPAAANNKPRQLGGIACNVARLQVVSALGNAESAVGQIQDADTASAAQAGLDQANGGISEIASAVLAGEQAPDSGREAVEAGLTATNAALSAGDSSDAAVADAQAAVADAASAGQDVVAQCV